MHIILAIRPSILQAHPTLEELTLSLLPEHLPRDLVSALKAEQKDSLESGKSILYPKLRRFGGYDEGLQLFLPNRRIECVASFWCGAEHIHEMDQHVSVWLNPILKPSYQRIRVLEVWANQDDCISFLPTIAPYLTSLTYLFICDDIRILAEDSGDYDLSSAFGQSKVVSPNVACRPYTRWLSDSCA